MAEAAKVAPLAQARERKMTLDKVVKGRIEAPVRVLIYGPEGVGKSTFAADAPAPIFLAPEAGTNQLDVARFPLPETWQDVLDAIATLRTDKHDYQTLAIDTLDHLEPILWRHVCAATGVACIEDVGGGYGKGYVAALDLWREFLAMLELLSRSRGMHIVMVAHSQVRPFRSPDSEDFDRYELKVNLKAAGLLKEWSDAVLFAQYETLTAKDARTKRVRGVSTGARLIHTVRTAAWDAKNRFNLEESMPLSWADFFAGTRSQQDPAALVAAITEKLPQLPDALRARAKAAMDAAASDPARLARINDRVNADIAANQKEGA